MKKEWTVRVINYIGEEKRVPNNTLPGVWVEQLRYMSLVSVLAKNELVGSSSQYDDYEVLEFYAPPKVDTKIWAEQNADRMKSFGINAVAAPKW